MVHTLVTGGSGYIGTCMAPQVLDLGHCGRVQDRLNIILTTLAAE